MNDRALIERLRALATHGGTPDDEALRVALTRLGELTATVPRRTLPVRIALVMPASGAWYAYGQSGTSDEDMCQEALGQVGDDPRVCYIVTADVPVPDVREIEGRTELAPPLDESRLRAREPRRGESGSAQRGKHRHYRHYRHSNSIKRCASMSWRGDCSVTVGVCPVTVAGPLGRPSPRSARPSPKTTGPSPRQLFETQELAPFK
jgi:hypothetical protein